MLRLEGKAKISGELEIANELVSSLKMNLLWAVHVATENADSEGYIGSRGDSKVVDTAHNVTFADRSIYSQVDNSGIQFGLEGIDRCFADRSCGWFGARNIVGFNDQSGESGLLKDNPIFAVNKFNGKHALGCTEIFDVESIFELLSEEVDGIEDASDEEIIDK